MRFTAYVGVLAVSLLVVVANAGIACADTDGAAGTEPETASVTSKSDDSGAGTGASGASNHEPPSSTSVMAARMSEFKPGKKIKRITARFQRQSNSRVR